MQKGADCPCDKKKSNGKLQVLQRRCTASEEVLKRDLGKSVPDSARVQGVKPDKQGAVFGARWT